MLTTPDYRTNTSLEMFSVISLFDTSVLNGTLCGQEAPGIVGISWHRHLTANNNWQIINPKILRN